MIKKTLLQEVRSRVETLLWSTGYMVVAYLVDYSIKNVTELNLPEVWIVVLGLVLAQISKFVKNWYSDYESTDSKS